jgi:hypothetical protein
VTAVAPGTGLNDGGQSVTISGSNFTNVTAVMFGSQPAAGFTLNGAAAIVATTPASLGSADSTSNVDVIVTNDLGTSPLSSLDLFTYTHNTLIGLSLFNVTSVHGGTSIPGFVTVAVPAPPSGYVIAIQSSSTSASGGGASIPATVSIAPKFTTGSFLITTSAVQSEQCFRLQATMFATQTAAFCVEP